MRRRHAVLAAVSAAALILGAVVPARAETPTEELRRYTDRVLAIVRSPSLSPRDKRLAVQQVAVEVFDVGETARRALGVHWQARTPAERLEFVRLFRDLLERTYVDRIDEYGGESLRFLDERVEGDLARVRGLIVTAAGLEVPVESRLALKDGRWRVYDVILANVSLVANYRAQFDRIIRASSYEDLVKRLKARVELLSDREPEAGRGAKPERR